MTILDRILMFLDHKNISERKFSSSIGASSSYLASIKSGNRSIGGDTLQNILITYQEIDAQWLMTGEGEMIKDGFKKPKTIDEMIEQKIEAKLKSIGYTFEDYKTLHEMRDFIKEQKEEARKVMEKQKKN